MSEIHPGFSEFQLFSISASQSFRDEQRSSQFNISDFQFFSVSEFQMSDEVVISVEGLGKKYRLGAGRANERYTALRDVIAEKARSLFRNPQSAIRSPQWLGSGRFRVLGGRSGAWRTLLARCHARG